MGILKMIFRLIAGLGAMYYGANSNQLEVLGTGWQWAIGIGFWIIFILLLDVSEALD